MDTFDRRREALRLAQLAFCLSGAALLAWSLGLAALIAAGLHAADYVAPGRSAWNSDLAAIVAGSVYAVALLMLWTRARALRRGGGTAEAERFGALPMDRRARAYLILEELTAATGVPMPELWVHDSTAVNAFTVGIDPTDAVIVLTRACCDELDDAELRGVVAHELARIPDGDALLNTRISCYTQLLLAPTVLTRWLRVRRRTTRLWILRPYWWLWTAACKPIAAPSYVFARAIKALLTRLRCVTADTTAILIAGDPHGLNSVLRRTADDDGICAADLTSPRAAEYDHAFLAPQLGIALGRSPMWRLRPAAAVRMQRIGLAQGQITRDRSFAEANLKQIAVPADEVRDRLGEIEFEQVLRAATLAPLISDDLRESLRDPVRCHAVACSLLTRGDAERHSRQRRRFEEHGCPHAVLATRDVHDAVRTIDPAVGLTLADLAMPTLRRMSTEQRARFRDDLVLLANGSVEPLEFFTALVWLHHVRRADEPRGLFRRSTRLDKDRWRHVVTFLLATARVHNPDQKEARRAFGDGAREAGVPAGKRLFSDPDNRVIAGIRTAIEVFADCGPRDQKQLLEGCVLATSADAAIEPIQLETLRAIRKAMGCAASPELDPQRDDAVTETAESFVPDRIMSGLWQDELTAAIAVST